MTPVRNTRPAPAREDIAMYTIYRLVALFAFVTSMLGCDHPHRSFTQRTTANGVDLLDSQVEILASRAHFDCRTALGGSCHYTVFAKGCDGQGACRQAQLRQLVVAAGAEQEVTDLPATVQVCVRADSTAVNARCQPLPPAS